MNHLTISVIIPSHNRLSSLMRLLKSIDEQNVAKDKLEVIICDDNSSYDPALIDASQFRFSLRHERLSKVGATLARNHGAQISRGALLVFIDDDVSLHSDALASLADAIEESSCSLVIGSLQPSSDNLSHPFTRFAIAENHVGGTITVDLREVHFTWCNTQLLAVRRQDFFALGMLQDPTGGWPNWDDVDFGYRAYTSGFRIVQSSRARGAHWDYALESLDVACRRWYRASKASVRLFEVHPELLPHLPMFRDKTALALGSDPPSVSARKLIRRLSAQAPMLTILGLLVTALESLRAPQSMLAFCYRGIQGAYLWKGYADGLRHRAATGQHS